MIRLLQKSEIDKAKATDRKREIDEGVKLAKRVDSLREVQAQEEAALEKFRVATLSKIHDEIKKVSDEKGQLEQEVSILKREREEALRPITQELRELDLRRQRDDSLRISLNAEKDDLDLRRVRADERERSIEVRERESIVAHAESLRLHKEAIEKHSDAKWFLDDAQKIREVASREKKEVEEEAFDRLLEVSARERSCQIIEANLHDREEEITKEQIRLADMRQTLERAFTRIKK